MSHDELPEAIPFRTLDRVSGAVRGLLAVLLLIGVASLVLAAGAEDHGRVWRGLLFNWLFWSSVAQGMVMVAVALHITHASWAWSIRRLALGGVAFLPLSFLLLGVVYLGSEVYFHHWLHVEGDPVIDAKRAWLNLPGLITRDVVGLLLLYGLSGVFAYFSLRPDLHGNGTEHHRGLYGRLTRGWRGGETEQRRSQRMLDVFAPILGLVFAVVWGMIAIDLAMSLAPHWFSTMFPVIFFMGAFLAGLAATAVAATWVRSRLDLRDFITRRQYHDLGKLVFAFSVFWMYLNWSQYIVVWYGLLPWEQEWFVERFQAPFAPFVQTAVALIFVLPFFGLLTRPPKQAPGILAFFAALILVGLWVERFLLVVPSIWEGEGTPFGLLEIGIGLGFLGLFLASFLWYLRSFPILPSPATLAAAGSSTLVVPARTVAAEH